MADTLSIPERMLITRRRRGETQASAAERCGVSNTRYSMWERGVVDVEAAHVPGPMPFAKLALNEQCLITRRRAGKTQGEVAEALNRCKMTMRQMERGEIDCHELASYWGLEGAQTIS